MKYSKLKRTVALLLAGVTLFTMSGCSKEEVLEPVIIEPMEVEEVYAYSPDFIGGTDVMPIAGFYGPYEIGHSYMGVNVPSYISDEIFSKLSECGINMIKQSNLDAKSDPEGQIKILELAEKYGMAVYVRHSDVYGRHGGEEFTTEAIGNAINQFANYPAFAGIDLVDEPGTDYWWSTLPQGFITDYAQRVDLLNDMRISFGANAIGAIQPSLGETGERYLTDFCSILKPPYLCHTNYTFGGHPDDISDDDAHKQMRQSLYILDKCRSYANEYKVPLWRYLNAGGQMTDAGTAYDSTTLYPTEGQMLWEVNTTLAYGGKGLSYFTLIQPLHFSYAKSEPYDSNRTGLIGVWGNKTPYWYGAKKANEQVAAIDHVLMNSVNKGILVSGKNAKQDTTGNDALLEGTSWRELKHVDGSTMVGCFNYQGKSAFYVVNYEFNYKQKITLDFHNAYNMTVIQKAESSNINTSQLTLDMEPGEGVLIVMD